MSEEEIQTAIDRHCRTCKNSKGCDIEFLSRCPAYEPKEDDNIE